MVRRVFPLQPTNVVVTVRKVAVTLWNILVTRQFKTDASPSVLVTTVVVAVVVVLNKNIREVRSLLFFLNEYIWDLSGGYFFFFFKIDGEEVKDNVRIYNWDWYSR